MSLLANGSIGKENKGNALTIGKEARIAKSKDNTVIDSTIGMLYDEDGSFYTFKMVDKVLNQLSPQQKYAYPPTAGDLKFQNAIKSWVFKDYQRELLSKMSCEVIATPGGTGAICLTLSNYLNPNDKVLLPSEMWTNYIQMAREANLGYEQYNMFNENGNFDLEDLKKKCLYLAKEQGRVLLIINDPCQNPTGYSMKHFEWEALVEIINSIATPQTPFILLYDMAYIDYDRRGFKASRDNIKLLTNLNENALCVMAFSGSKTLGLYGLRIGAAIAVSKSEEVIKEFYSANEFSARGMWSSSSILGANVISEVLTSYKEEFESELLHASQTLISRANTFINEAKKANIKSLPYECGFFVTIPCENPSDVFEVLKSKGVYIIPLKNAIRVTVSSISNEEIVRLVGILKDVLK